MKRLLRVSVVRAIQIRSCSTIAQHEAPSSEKMIPKIVTTDKGREQEWKVEMVPEAEFLKSLETHERKQFSVGYYTAPIINLKREQQGTIELPQSIFGEKIRTDIIHRCLLSRMSQRAAGDGIKPTKIISQVAGSNKKMRAQKGGGCARKGQRRVGIHRGGEKAHGRYQRDVSFELPDKVLKLGMRSALSAKYALGQIVVLDKLQAHTNKTSIFSRMLSQFKWGTNVLFVDDNVQANVRLASRNIPEVEVSTLKRVNIWDVLRKKYIVLTPEAIQQLEIIYHESKDTRKELQRKLLEQQAEEQAKNPAPVNLQAKVSPQVQIKKNIYQKKVWKQRVTPVAKSEMVHPRVKQAASEKKLSKKTKQSENVTETVKQ